MCDAGVTVHGLVEVQYRVFRLPEYRKPPGTIEFVCGVAAWRLCGGVLPRSPALWSQPEYPDERVGAELVPAQPFRYGQTFLTRRPLRSRFEGWPNCEGLE